MTTRLCAVLLGLLAVLSLGGQAAAPPESAAAAAAPDATPAVKADTPPPAGAGAAPLSLPSGGNVAIIPIDGIIYEFTLRTLERRVDRALAAGASVIVLEIDTPGGVATAALEISKYLKTVPAPTVAWINNDAYSAGVVIAGACDLIVMSPASATGDCAPIALHQNLAPTERAKALSPLLEELRDSAQQNGHDYTLFHAMCVLGVELYLIEHPQTGERRVVNQLDYSVLVEGADPSAAEAAAATGAQFSTGQATTPADAQAVGQVFYEEPPGPAGERWKLVRQIHDGTTLLTLNQTRAVDVGFARGIVANEAELVKFLGAGAVMTVRQHWVEEIAFWLMHPAARGLLLVVFLVGAYLEFQSPGVGIFGIISLLAMGLLLGAPFMVGLAQAWHVVVVLLGLAMLVLELTYLPGFGLIGVAGVVLMLVGLAFAAVPSGDTFGPAGGLPAAEMWGRAALSLLWMVLGLVGSLVAFFFMAKHFDELPLFNRMVLQNPLPVPAGTPEPPVSGEEEVGGGIVAVGDTGRAATELRPAGRAEIEGELLDVVSVGAWVDAGTPIRVVEVHGNRIVVDTL